ncbi:Pre-mRNA-splicing factor PRP9 [Gossypium arboreum]|uniref:Uncharacterized protein n=2 Tax=Gossypium arboreum TaxID=29729 RepID=A0ABR0N464_GOSAR|nr:uncharacterized protein LOC108473674 isoform X1 [Gossypium arboreum]KAK5784409.1 hypothetical protein PVK06_038932 [Gossypium arboreum]KHG05312.1 Pre-mRNA-splicing factor PRP9 [Gossypium arboreum]
MIKRRFYKFEHADKDNVSDSSSSSSDSELEVEASEESESEPEQEVAAQVNQNNQACSSSSGYESEDSSANEVGVDSAGLIDDDNDESEDDKQIFINRLHTEHGAQIRGKKSDVPCNKEPLPDDFPACILKCKSVFKCKLCPRIVCLNEETARAHFNSKRHARSEKLLKEGRLKTMLNSDGEIENQETAAEAYSPVVAIEQDKQKMKHKGGRHRRGKGSKRKRMRDEKQSTKDGVKKGRKDEN